MKPSAFSRDGRDLRDGEGLPWGLVAFVALVFSLGFIAKALEILSNLLFQSRGFRELFLQFRGEAFHLFFERLRVFLGGFSTDITAGGQHVAMGTDFLEGGGLAEAGGVCVKEVWCFWFGV